MRTVEPGSRLVAVPSGGTVAVLQLPRGNLEVVSPRILVLKAIAAELQVSQAVQGRPRYWQEEMLILLPGPSVLLTVPLSCAETLLFSCPYNPFAH